MSNSWWHQGQNLQYLCAVCQRQDTIIQNVHWSDVEADSLSSRRLDILIDGKLKYRKRVNTQLFCAWWRQFGIDQGLYKAVLTHTVTRLRNPRRHHGQEKFMATRTFVLIYLKDPVDFTPDLTFSNTQGTLLDKLQYSPFRSAGQQDTGREIGRVCSAVLSFVCRYRQFPVYFSDSTYVR